MQTHFCFFLRGHVLSSTTARIFEVQSSVQNQNHILLRILRIKIPWILLNDTPQFIDLFIDLSINSHTFKESCYWMFPVSSHDRHENWKGQRMWSSRTWVSQEGGISKGRNCNARYDMTISPFTLPRFWSRRVQLASSPHLILSSKFEVPPPTPAMGTCYFFSLMNK